jgi:hypothetical protein
MSESCTNRGWSSYRLLKPYRPTGATRCPQGSGCFDKRRSRENAKHVHWAMCENAPRGFGRARIRPSATRLGSPRDAAQGQESSRPQRGRGARRARDLCARGRSRRPTAGMQAFAAPDRSRGHLRGDPGLDRLTSPRISFARRGEATWAGAYLLSRLLRRVLANRIQDAAFEAMFTATTQTALP